MSFDRAIDTVLHVAAQNLSSLENDGNALAHSDAHRGKSVTAASAVQLPRERRHKPSSGASQRMTQRNGTTQWIDDRRIELGPLTQAGQ